MTMRMMTMKKTMFLTPNDIKEEDDDDDDEAFFLSAVSAASSSDDDITIILPSLIMFSTNFFRALFATSSLSFVGPSSASSLYDERRIMEQKL